MISNLELKNAYPGTHATSNAAFLSAAKAKWTESTDYYLGTTVDQVAAQQIGHQTLLPSLELSMDLLQTVGQCDNGYACVYQNNLSWSSPTTPLPAEAHPRLVFERLFGEGGSAADRQRDAAAARQPARFGQGRHHAAAAARSGRRIARASSQYLDTVREVERRIQKAEAQTADAPLPDLDRPAGVPAAYADHARLMFDLQVLAMQGDVTRVITFQLARETSNRTYTEIGVPDPHHPLTHHGNDPAKVARMAKINAFHVSLFAYYLEKLKATPEGDGSLLDHSLILYGSGMGDPNIHNHVNLPILVAGGGAGSATAARVTSSTRSRRRSRICTSRCSSAWVCASTPLPTARAGWTSCSRFEGEVMNATVVQRRSRRGSCLLLSQRSPLRAADVAAGRRGGEVRVGEGPRAR